MKYTIINGLEDKREHAILQDNVKAVLAELGYLQNSNENWINFYEHEIKNCVGCDYCANVNPGQCVLEDSQCAILKQFMTSDTVLILTSIHFGCCNVQTKNFMDRSEPLFLPYQVNNGKRSVMKGRYDRYPKVVVVGIGDVSDIEKKCFCEYLQSSTLLQVCHDTVVKACSKDMQVSDWRKILNEK